MSPTRIREIMRPARWVDSLDSLGEVQQTMREASIRHLPVLHAGKVVGIVSERDLLEYRSALGFAEGWRDYGVSGVMTRSPRTAGPDEAIVDVASRLATSRFGALPVVEDGLLVGIVTIGDVLDAERPHDRRAARATTAADAMTPGPFTATPDESLLTASRRMSTHGIRHLPVVDEVGQVIGMLSERDVRTAVGDAERFAIAGDRVGLRVSDAMSTSPLTVLEDRPIVELAKIFQDVHIGAVPVLDRDDRLVGIVSYVDALRALATHAEAA